MLQTELENLEADPFNLIGDLDRPEDTDVAAPAAPAVDHKAPTLVVDKIDENAPEVSADALVEPVTDLSHATLSDLSEGLKKMADDQSTLSDTIILK